MFLPGFVLHLRTGPGSRSLTLKNADQPQQIARINGHLF